MKQKLKAIQPFWGYILFALWGITIFLMTRFLAPIPLSLMLVVGWAVFAPGFVLGRLLRIKLETGLDRTILALALGFLYSWLWGFVAIASSLTISALVVFWLIGLGVLAAIAIFLDAKKPTPQPLEVFKFKEIFKVENLPWLLAFISAFLIIMYLVRIGALFKGGDTNYHLATLRKVIDDQPLTIHNLSYARDKMMIVYAFPIWHIFVGLIVKFTNTNIFVVWRDLAAALLLLAMPVWYWLSRKVVPSRNGAILAFIAFAFFGFWWGPAYTYSSFGVPHTFSQLLLLPLAAGLSLIYAFNKTNWTLLVVLILLILTGTAVHITFYFYLLTILLSFLIFYTAFCWQQPDYKQIIKNLLILIGCQLLIVVPLAIAMEIKGHAISNYFRLFQDPTYPTTVRYKSIAHFNGHALYAYIFLPLLLAWLKKYPKLILPIAALMAVPLIYFTPLRAILAKLVGAVYLNRLYGSLDWGFLVWGVVLGFALVMVDRTIAQIVKLKANRLAIDLSLVFLVVLLFYWQAQTRWAQDLWKTIFDGQFLSLVEKNYIYPLIFLSVIGLGLFVWQIFKPKPSDPFEQKDTKAYLANFLFASLAVLIIAAPDWSVFKTYLLEKNGPEYFWREMAAGGQAKADSYSAVLGGKKVINFINKNIPSKSVFDTNSGYFYLPIMVDQHLPIYHSGAAKEHLALYFDETTLPKRLEILHQYQIDYLLVKPPKEGDVPFDQYPRYFTKIFAGEHIIYQVNKPAINTDYPQYCPPRKDGSFKDYIL